MPVTDIDRAKTFYAEWLNFPGGPRLELQRPVPGGAAGSTRLGMLDRARGAVEIAPGSLQGLQLVAPDVRAARAELVERGVPVSDVMVVGPGGERPLDVPHSWSSIADVARTLVTVAADQRG